MRRPVNAAQVREFLHRLGVESRASGRVYITGGASLVLLRLRDEAIDIDLISDDDTVLRAAAALRDAMNINIDREQPRFAAPGWQERCSVITRAGLSFLHLDFYAHALAKLERGHHKDLADVRAMLRAGIVTRQELRTILGNAAMDRTSMIRAVESLQ